MRPVTGSSPSPGCRAANGRAFAPPTPSNGSMKSSSAGSKPRPCCRLPRPQRCCSGHCSPRVRSPCAKSTGGRPPPRNPLTSRLTSLPDPISSPLPETALIKFQPKSRQHPDQTLYENYVCDAARNYTNYCSPELDKLIDQQSMEADAEKRRLLVWKIERKLAEDGVQSVIFYGRFATCWQPRVKGITVMVNSLFNGWRMEDVWLDK